MVLNIVNRFFTFLLLCLIICAGCNTSIEGTGLFHTDAVEVTMDGMTRYNLLPSSGGSEVKTFTLTVNYPWTISYNSDWLTIDPTSGVAGEEYIVKISATENKFRVARETTMLLSVEKDGWTKDYTIVQRGPEGVDSHADGHLFFDEDFSWMKDAWNTAEKYGVPEYENAGLTNAVSVSSLTKGNELMDKNFTAFNSINTTGRADGYLVMGDSESPWVLTTKYLDDIDNDSKATIDISFDASVYSSLEGVKDAGIITISIEGNGEFVAAGDDGAIASTDKKSVTLDLSNEDIWSWHTHHIIFKDVTNASQITFCGEASSRMALDNIKVARCDDEMISAPATTIAEPEIDFEFTIDLTEEAPGIQDDIAFSVRSNRAWTIESDSDWITFSKIAIVTGNATGVQIATDGRSASAPSTRAQYCGSFLRLSTNNIERRTGSISLKIDGLTVKTISISQAVVKATEGDVAKWTFTGLYYKTFGGIAPIPTSPGYIITKCWAENHYAESDIVKGGILSAHVANDKASFTGSAPNRPANSLRIGQMSKGDYFLFSVDLVMVEEGSTIQFKNAGLAVTSYVASPVDWIEEYSLDGENWITIKEIHLTSGHYPIGKEDETHSLDFEIPIASDILKATLQVRVRIATNNTGTTSFKDGAADIAYIYSSPFIKVDTYENKTATYTGERDYLVFTVKK